MVYSEDEYLQLSGIQHFAFCRRQWALIHIEMMWSDNERTASGDVFHERVDEPGRVSRDGILSARSVRVSSPTLGLSGICDVIEFTPDDGTEDHTAGAIHPVEYKVGKRKKGICDTVQLCAQSIAIEESLGVTINEGYIFYGKERHRLKVDIDDDLRESTVQLAEEMHSMFDQSFVPEASPSNACNECSLKEYCMPSASGNSVDSYMETMRRSS